LHRPCKRDGIAENLSGHECFLYDGQGQTLTVLNTSALFIWSLCDGEHAEDDILAVMHQIYPDAPPDLLKADIRRILDGFMGQELLRDR
jgi:hypothetical protein